MGRCCRIQLGAADLRLSFYLAILLPVCNRCLFTGCALGLAPRPVTAPIAHKFSAASRNPTWPLSKYVWQEACSQTSRISLAKSMQTAMPIDFRMRANRVFRGSEFTLTTERLPSQTKRVNTACMAWSREPMWRRLTEAVCPKGLCWKLPTTEMLEILVVDLSISKMANFKKQILLRLPAHRL